MKNVFSFYTITAATMLAMAMMTRSVHAGKGQDTIAEIVIATSGGVDVFDHKRNDYDVLLKAVMTAGLDGALSDPTAQLTLFAPTDAAFYQLAKDLGYTGGYDEPAIFDFLVEALGTLGDAVAILTDVLLYHVADGELTSDSIRHIALSYGSITTLQGATIAPKIKTFGRFSFWYFWQWSVVQAIVLEDKDLDIPNPNVIRPNNLEAKNGIIHSINRVLLPLDI